MIYMASWHGMPMPITQRLLEPLYPCGLILLENTVLPSATTDRGDFAVGSFRFRSQIPKKELLAECVKLCEDCLCKQLSFWRVQLSKSTCQRCARGIPSYTCDLPKERTQMNPGVLVQFRSARKQNQWHAEHVRLKQVKQEMKWE